MDFVNVLKNELFRPVATLIVPGSLAFFPYALLIANINPGVVSVWEGHNGVVVTMFLMVALALGMVIENIGSLIEILIDGVLGDEHINRWREYLGLRVQDEIIGQRYLRTLVLRLKFELSALVAIPISYLGFLLLNQVSGYWSFFSMIIGISLFSFFCSPISTLFSDSLYPLTVILSITYTRENYLLENI